MARIKKMDASTLVEALISMSLTIFLVTLVSWFFLEISHSKQIDINGIVYEILINERGTDTINNNFYMGNNVSIKISRSYIDKKLMDVNYSICNSQGKELYKFNRWVIENQ